MPRGSSVASVAALASVVLVLIALAISSTLPAAWRGREQPGGREELLERGDRSSLKDAIGVMKLDHQVYLPGRACWNFLIVQFRQGC